MSDEIKKEDPIVGYEWDNDQVVSISGTEFRKVINLINQYPKTLGEVLEKLMQETVDMFEEVQQELDNIVEQMAKDGIAKPMYFSELEAKIREMQNKMGGNNSEQPN